MSAPACTAFDAPSKSARKPSPVATASRPPKRSIAARILGSKVVKALNEAGHDAISASPRSGVDASAGRGLAEALAGADVVVDVSNSPSFEDAAVLAFFESSAGNLARSEREAGVKHHVALSIVGIERHPDSGYFRAKLAQEAIIKEAGVPYTIVRATQFCEFLDAIAGAGTVDGKVRLPGASFQPIASRAVAVLRADRALSEGHRGPARGRSRSGGPLLRHSPRGGLARPRGRRAARHAC
jgi:uncharacterized protein YbjT (DUF2867 family)